MSELEREFYACLCKLLNGADFIVLPKVSLSSVIEGARGQVLNEIADFCVFNTKYEPLLVIKIDGGGRDAVFPFCNKEKRLRAALEAAGLPCMSLWTNYGAKMEYIEETLRGYMQYLNFS